MKPISSSLIHRVLMPERSTGTMYPTLLMLHGRGADEEDLLGLSSYLDDRLLILSVRAPLPFTYGGGYTWYEFDAVGTPEPNMFRESYEKLVLFLDDALKAYPIDKKKIFLFGFSMGAMMSYSLSLTRPEVFRGVMANSGYIPEGTYLTYRWKDIAHLEFFIAHGSLDPVIPATLGKRAKDLLKAEGARLTYKEYPMGHQISEESLADLAAWLKLRLET